MDSLTHEISRYYAVLHRLHRHLGAEINWAITGSLGFALQGVATLVRDIDVQTDGPGAFAIEKRFAAYVLKPVEFSATDRVHQGVEFRNVAFRYPGTDRYVLHDVSFTIHPQTAVAIVGENGAGKTTLVKLLTRLYDPTEGVILLDGCDLRTYDLADLRSQIGVIFQDFVRYNLTARENIGFGELEYVEDLERVAQAADRGGAAPVIGKLANSYATMLGRTFENGVDLSGGEWQKLALGRAFMRQSQILILDEPTAALDALAEYEVYRRFAELTAGRTTVFISHRFSTVRMAQQILVLADGQVVESGNHAELMARNGRYAEMFKVQAERYQ